MGMNCKAIEQMSVAIQLGVRAYSQERFDEKVVLPCHSLFVHRDIFTIPEPNKMEIKYNKRGVRPDKNTVVLVDTT